MYLPRSIISHLYTHLLRNLQPLSPPVLILAALETDALCACRILTALLRRDYIPHKIQPVAGYADLARASQELIAPMKTTEGGNGGIVVCLGVGGLVDLAELLGLESEEADQDMMGGIEVWVLDARRPWNLGNVFGGLPPLHESELGHDAHQKLNGVDRGRVQKSYHPGQGGIIVFDDGDIEDELSAERDAYWALAEMPEVEDVASEDSDIEEAGPQIQDHSKSRKRKSWSDREDEDSESAVDEDAPPRRRRRSNLSSSISVSSPRQSVQGSSNVSRSGTPPTSSSEAPSARHLRKRFLALRRTHESTLNAYYELGTSYSEPISSLMYSLASDLGRENNDLLWLAIVGVSSLELSGRSPSGISLSTGNITTRLSNWHTNRQSRILALMRDEVRRLNPPMPNESPILPSTIQTSAKSPTDTSIRLSPEPRFLLIRHWTLYESMLHSPYLASRLHLWNDNGIKRLHKLLAKMGVSLAQCRQRYTHMDMDVKRILRDRLLKYSSVYGLEGLVPSGDGIGLHGKEGWGFVRSWGWKACLSATDVGVITGAILEVGSSVSHRSESSDLSSQISSAEAVAPTTSSHLLPKFFTAYDALSPGNPDLLLHSLASAQSLLRAIHRTGTSLMAKHQIRHLRAFRMGVVKDGPDLSLFSNSPGALVKLALWVGEAVAVREKEDEDSGAKERTPLVLGALSEERDIYTVVGIGTGGIGRVESPEKKAEKEKRRREKEGRKKVREEKRAARLRVRDELGNGGDEEEEESEAESSDSGSDSDADVEDTSPQKPGYGRNRFGLAFQEVVEETNARVRIDSFEHCVVEVKKADLAGFLEGLSGKSVIGR